MATAPTHTDFFVDVAVGAGCLAEDGTAGVDFFAVVDAAGFSVDDEAGFFFVLDDAAGAGSFTVEEVSPSLCVPSPCFAPFAEPGVRPSTSELSAKLSGSPSAVPSATLPVELFPAEFFFAAELSASMFAELTSSSSSICLLYTSPSPRD